MTQMKRNWLKDRPLSRLMGSDRSRVCVQGNVVSLAGFKAAAQTSLDERQNASEAGVGKGKAIARRQKPD